MSTQHVNPVPIKESSTRFRHQYTIAGLFVFVAILGGAVLLTLQQLQPLQRYYLARYAWASATPQKSIRATFVELQDHGRLDLARPFDVAELQGHLVLSQWAVDHTRGPLAFTPRTVPPEYFTQILRDYVYGGRSAADILSMAKFLIVGAFVFLAIAAPYLDWKNNKRREDGILRRGPKLLDRDEFNRTLKSKGVGFPVEGKASMRELLFAPRWRRGVIRLPHEVETSHLLIVGSTGTGKSQLLVQLMHEIQYRQEGAILYDPDGEFAAEFYDPARGDVILNPLDRRSPYWCPAAELANNEESLTLAASLFPDPAKADEKNTFFVRAPRQILARLFEYEPSPQDLCAWLADQAEIDKRIKGTEMEAMLSKAAGPQRSGILASLSMALNAFRLLPPREDCTSQWSAKEWAKRRQGWIFLTSREATREIQKPLMSLWLDTLLLRLMAKPADGSVLKPVWLIVDELASLQKLPSLQGALTRARKYQIKTVLGFQAQSQVQEIYGKEGAETIMGNPSSRIFFRTGDPSTADWVSRTLGEQEVAKEKMSYTKSGALGGRKSRTYSIEVKPERAVSASQIAGLRNLHGYIRIYDCIAAFRLKYEPRTPHCEPFIRRDDLGFVPLTLPEPFQIYDPAARTTGAQDGSTPLPVAATVPATAAGGGGGMAIGAQATPDEQELDLPYSDTAKQQPIVQLDNRTSLAGAAARIIATREAGYALNDAAHTVGQEPPADTGHSGQTSPGGPEHIPGVQNLNHLLNQPPHAQDSTHATPFDKPLQAMQQVLTTAAQTQVPTQLQPAMHEVQQQVEHAENEIADFGVVN
jgi:hypothetical protein